MPTESTEIVLAVLMVSELRDEEVEDYPPFPWSHVCIVLQADRNRQVYKRMNFPEEPLLVLVGAVKHTKDLFIHSGKRSRGMYADMPFGMMKCTRESRLQTQNFGIFLIGHDVN